MHCEFLTIRKWAVLSIKMTKQLSILLILSLILTSLTIQVSKAAEFKQKVFITDRRYPFFQYPFFQQQFSQTSTSNFLKRAHGIQTQAKAIILDYNISKEVSSEARTQMRDMLIGEGDMMILFVMGYGVTTNFIQEYLEVRTKSVVEIPEVAETQLYATGLYNIGIYSGGPFMLVNMVSYERIPYERQLKNLDQVIDKIIKMQIERSNPPYWKRMDVLMHNYDSVFCGKYNQTVDIQKMENDGSNTFDYWMAKVTNESVSGIHAHKNGYKNETNDTKLDMDNPSQKIITYGPGGDVSEDSNVTVTIGVTDASVSWGWSTGKTSLKNTEPNSTLKPR